MRSVDVCKDDQTKWEMEQLSDKSAVALRNSLKDMMDEETPPEEMGAVRLAWADLVRDVEYSEPSAPVTGVQTLTEINIDTTKETDVDVSFCFM